MVDALPHPSGCNGNQGLYFFILMSELVCILVLSHLFHLLLKPLGQPAPIAQIFAGLVLSALSHNPFVEEFVFPETAKHYYGGVSTLSRTIFMFLIGLEIDVPYVSRTLRQASILACGGFITCCVLAAGASQLIYPHIHAIAGSRLPLTLTLMLLTANAASPLVIRMTTEMKLATSEVGRLAISASLVNDISCFHLLALRSTWKMASDGDWQNVGGGVLCVCLVAGAVFVNKVLARWSNQRNRHRRLIENMEVIPILLIVILITWLLESMDYSGDAACFFLGVLFPREGKTIRTLLHKLAYPVYNFILPVYFGYMGFQADLTHFNRVSSVLLVFVLICLNVIGKIGGTLAACRYLKIPYKEGIVLGFLLNLKGHVDLLILSWENGRKHKWGPAFSNVLMIATTINSLIVGPTVTYLVRRERKAVAFSYVGLEWQKPDSELRILSCVHGPRHVATMAGIIAASTGSNKAPVTPYLMHLVEFTGKNRAYVLYNQREDDDINDDDNYGGNDALEINDAVDAFTAETGIMIRLFTAVSPFDSMYEDVCNGAEDVRASIVLLPFHKIQRIDGMMEDDKAGIRTTNQKVLRHSPCSVGIVVDRGFSGPASVSNLETATRQQVAVLFFGGPDDREALAFSSRLATHPDVNMTLVRFLPENGNENNQGINFATSNDEEVLMAISGHETENDTDQAFVSSFYNRYVTSGEVEYVEKYVKDGAETVTALSGMAEMYSLFIVGKGGRGLSPLTMGMSEWEECPELGEVGDLLASSDVSISGSVLVIQQHRRPKKDFIDDEFRVT